ncbi:MAG: sulfotransferase, partial [Hyphomicrobiales bacterium]
VLSKYTEKDFKKVGRRYLKELENADDKAIRIVDKMPHNFEMLWLIALLFPNAKFILMKRNSNDICNSIYTTSFNSWHSYNIDQKTLGQYYNTYEDLIDHWKSVLPIEIFELDYENLIADQEEESRKLLDHIGLDWDPACLEFYNNENRVFTASQSQVRQPIYSSSVGRWKKYENYIQPLLQELNIKHTLGTT